MDEKLNTEMVPQVAPQEEVTVQVTQDVPVAEVAPAAEVAPVVVEETVVAVAEPIVAVTDDNSAEVEEIEESMEDFGAMLEESEMKSARLKNGMKVKARIISISEEMAFVDVGAKIDGFVETVDLRDEEGNLTVKEGDQIDLYVVSVSEDEIKLSHAMSGNAGMTAIRDAYDAAVPVTGKVLNTVKGGFTVQVMGRRAFCPISQIDTCFVENTEEYINQTYNFKITKFEARGKNIVVSRIPILKEAEKENIEKLRNEIDKDTVFKGTVKRIQPYGLFVEFMPGVDGMVHVSEISWSRVDDPSKLYNVGDQVEIKVLEIKDTGKNMRIALTMKQLKPEPWSFIDSRFNVGDVVEGKVTRLAPFGCFVEISEGVEGLVHVSELSWERNNVKTEDIVKSGDMVSVKIIEIQMEKRKISLSFRQAGNDPWQDASEKYPVGSMVNGILEKKEKFGYFMTVAPGVTGLLPKSKIDLAVNAKEIENASIGDSIPLSVIDLNLSQRKMTLAPELEPSEDWRSFNQQTKKEEADDGDMGALGLALMQKLGK